MTFAPISAAADGPGFPESTLTRRTAFLKSSNLFKNSGARGEKSYLSGGMHPSLLPYPQTDSFYGSV